MRKFFFVAFVLPGIMLLCTSYQKLDNGNSKNALVGSWELVRGYTLDSMFHDDRRYGLAQYYKVVGPDSTFTHGKRLMLTFKSDNKYIARFRFALFDEYGHIKRYVSGTDTSTYSLPPGGLDLLDPRRLLELCEPAPNDTAA